VRAVLGWTVVAAIATLGAVVWAVRRVLAPSDELQGSAWLDKEIERHQRERREDKHEAWMRGLR
jgi:hypothetical protein